MMGSANCEAGQVSQGVAAVRAQSPPGAWAIPSRVGPPVAQPAAAALDSACFSGVLLRAPDLEGSF